MGLGVGQGGLPGHRWNTYGSCEVVSWQRSAFVQATATTTCLQHAIGPFEEEEEEVVVGWGGVFPLVSYNSNIQLYAPKRQQQQKNQQIRMASAGRSVASTYL